MVRRQLYSAPIHTSDASDRTKGTKKKELILTKPKKPTLWRTKFLALQRDFDPQKMVPPTHTPYKLLQYRPDLPKPTVSCQTDQIFGRCDTGDAYIHDKSLVYDDIETYKNQSYFNRMQVDELRERLHVMESQLAHEKAKHSKQINAVNKLYQDQKSLVKTLTESVESKENQIQGLNASMSKIEASNAYRAVAIKTLKEELRASTMSHNESTRSLRSLQNYNNRITNENQILRKHLEEVNCKIAALMRACSELDGDFEEQLLLIRKESSKLLVQCNTTAAKSIEEFQTKYNAKFESYLKSLTSSDQTIKHLYLTIQKIVKGIHRWMYKDELERLEKEKSSGSEKNTSALLSCSSNIPQLAEWLEACNRLVHQEDFSDQLSKYILHLLTLQNSEKNQPKK